MEAELGTMVVTMASERLHSNMIDVLTPSKCCTMTKLANLSTPPKSTAALVATRLPKCVPYSLFVLLFIFLILN